MAAAAGVEKALMPVLVANNAVLLLNILEKEYNALRGKSLGIYNSFEIFFSSDETKKYILISSTALHDSELKVPRPIC